MSQSPAIGSVRIEHVDVLTIRPLRRALLRPTRPPEASVYEQDDDPATVHVAAFDRHAEVVGCVTVFPEPYDGEPNAWRLRGMATVPELRGQGVGAALLASAVEAVRSAGAPFLWCHAREKAQGFYAKYGFVGEGELFEIPVAGPHRIMRLTLR